MSIHLIFTALIGVVVVAVGWFAAYVVYRLYKQSR